jgi:excisionase family DNA binding protein
MNLRDRLLKGTPLRLSELAKYIGYSRAQVYKWADSGAITTVRMPIPGAVRLIPVAEAERIGRVLQII